MVSAISYEDMAIDPTGYVLDSHMLGIELLSKCPREGRRRYARYVSDFSRLCICLRAHPEPEHNYNS